MNAAVAAQRLHNQFITRQTLRSAHDVVSWFGAVQAQEYAPAKWGLGLRMRGTSTDATVERAFNEGRILRTHVMRPTWHFVSPSDIRWMLELTASNVHRRMSTYNRQLGLDDALLAKGTAILERALSDRQYLTRRELGRRLQQAGLGLDSMRLAHLAMYAELERVICSGPRRGKQSTYALLAERAPKAPRLPRDEALAELGRRFFRSHGPATIADFVWWSGLTTLDAKRSLEINKARHRQVDDRKYWTVGRSTSATSLKGSAHLLPIYDEYLVAYRHRAVVSHGPAVVPSLSGGFVNFQHAAIIEGQVTGTWKTVQTKRGVSVELASLRRLMKREQHALEEAAARYERFLGMPVSLAFI